MHYNSFKFWYLSFKYIKIYHDLPLYPTFVDNFLDSRDFYPISSKNIYSLSLIINWLDKLPASFQLVLTTPIFNTHDLVKIKLLEI